MIGLTMDYFKNKRSIIWLLFLLSSHITLTESRSHRLRHKRQHGSRLYLPESFIIPGGEGDGNWGPWGTPSECSRTCGGGVAYMTRECYDVDENGVERCRGGSKKYFSCNTQDCADSEVDFRRQQCSKFDATLFDGVRHSWVPYTKAPNPCELHCMPIGERFYYRHKDKVVDGTRCNDESFDVCVDGRCEHVGCDLMLGSDAREDKCRKCRGDGSSCRTLTGTFEQPTYTVGYNDILLIPEGATNIDVKERNSSSNYFAIRSLNGTYYLNGNYKIDFPRAMNFGGCIWHYERRVQGFAAPDRLTAIGPTTEAIYLVLLAQDKNVGIDYEYSVPSNVAPLIQPESYTWTFTDFGPCSASCGGGVQTRSVTCNGRNSMQEVEESLCDKNDRPAEQTRCGHHPCPPRWVEGKWSKCSAPCGENGTQARVVQCERATSDGVVTIVDDDTCMEKFKEKPTEQQSCNQGDNCSQWHEGPWTPCSKLCGEGKQTRKITCFRKEKDGKITVLTDNECPDDMPDAEQSCIIEPCEGVDYVTSPWTGCNTCGQTVETRSTVCASQKGKVFDEKFCANRVKPELRRECLETPQCEYQWFSSQWTKCSALCGKGTRSRTVLCGQFENGVITKSDDESKCDADLKPTDTEECDAGEKCPGQWFTGPWSDCSKECGGGERARKVLCIFNDTSVSVEKCDPEKVEDSSESCNTEACEEDELIPVSMEASTTSDGLADLDYCDYDGDYDETLLGAEEGVSMETTELEDMEEIGKMTEITGSSDGTTESTLETDELMLSDAASDAFTEFMSTSEATVEGSGGAEMRFDTESSGDGDEESTATSVAMSAAAQVSETTESETTDASTDAATSDSATSESATSAAVTTTESATEASTSQSGTSQAETSQAETSQAETTEAETTEEVTTPEVTTETSEEVTTVEQTSEASSTDAATSEVETSETATSEAATTEAATTEAETTEAGTTEAATTAAGSSEAGTSVAETSEAATTGAQTTSDGSTETATSDAVTTDASTDQTSQDTTGASTDASSDGSTERDASTTDIASTTPESDTDSTTLDIWSSSDATTDEDFEGLTTPNTIMIAIRSESAPRKCRPRPKIPKCTKSTFGCCADNFTPATGPFGEGCARPETCKDTKHGCCEDGVSPAKGANNRGCPKSQCADTLFGCCPDQKTPAQGNENEGCPIPTTTVKTCKTSKFGCCPDGETEAQGKKNKGCPVSTTPTPQPKEEEKECSKTPQGCAPCATEPFGCCPDGITPAHGHRGEGCCLEASYGCCPDNVTPAHGPNLEGCGCEYAGYGCCPDNTTAAEGPDNYGCGCKYSPHGCCPDQVTASPGDKYEGCPCHSFQFGCCPDGVKAATGPQGAGCHCSYSEFKCCSDGVTAAKGPNFDGCTCAESKFGCCTDGVNEAQGADFEGCETKPAEQAQKACRLPKDMGTCHNFTVKHFFDTEYGACSRFWYGGCDGNENRFDNQDDCKNVCENPPEPKDACILPKITGPCTGYYPMWYYDTDRNTCTQFIYGGCLGNANRFETAEDCQKSCLVDKALAPCDQPLDVGPCQGSFERWYFNKEHDRCEPFTFGGCKGNKNNYATEAACYYSCKKPGVGKDLCNLPKVSGGCSGKHARWHYSGADKKCLPFYYTGCDGNENAFVSQGDCEASCPPQIEKDVCHLPAETGDCADYKAHWYWDTKDTRCRQFYWGGCGGNGNNFQTETACEQRCKENQTPQPPREPERPREPFNVENCFKQQDSGSCHDRTRRYFYNSRYGTCEEFIYTGCEGNENNFESDEDCQRNCGRSQDRCSLHPHPGRCSENETRFYYDSRTDTCYEFMYTGCQGNANNFFDRSECESSCVRRRPEPTPIPSVPSRFVDPTCLEPRDYGNCTDNHLMYYFNAERDLCEPFYYSGCGGNANRFATLQNCELRCVEGDNGVDVDEPTIKDRCQDFYEECQRLYCPYGVSRSYDAEGCERCECEDPCRDYQCPPGQECAIEIRPHAQYGTEIVTECRDTVKPGRCPVLENGTRCDRECHTDANCRLDRKCCVAGCSTVCVAPETYQPPQHTRPPHEGAAPPALQEAPQSEIQKEVSEGGAATLRCFATGFPPPTVSWSKNAVILNTEEGRFSLTTGGDLQIVQLHRTDSGTYVCVADNGVGEPVSREISLTVTDPVSDDAYIIGERNSSQIVQLNQPTVIRCLSGGYPKPYTSWWRGTDMLPLKTARFEVNRDYSLVFNRVELVDLGPYVCHAYSGYGKPTSISVTLRTVGPVSVQSAEDEKYLQYVIDPADAPTAAPPVYQPNPPRPAVVPTEPPQPRNATVLANIVLPNGNKRFGVGGNINISCQTDGYPLPSVTWLKDSQPLEPSERVEITANHDLIIRNVDSSDSGYYKCLAKNEFSQGFHEEYLLVEGAVLPENCTDNQFFANCALIVKGNYCMHKYYAKFCCRSCTLAGQLSHL